MSIVYFYISNRLRLDPHISCYCSAQTQDWNRAGASSEGRSEHFFNFYGIHNSHGQTDGETRHRSRNNGHGPPSVVGMKCKAILEHFSLLRFCFYPILQLRFPIQASAHFKSGELQCIRVCQVSFILNFNSIDSSFAQGLLLGLKCNSSQDA